MQPVICAPMAVERYALRRATTPLVRTGMGPARSRRAARLLAGRPVLVAGVGGGLAASVRVGDAVVATSVLGPSGAVVSCPMAAFIADDLRRLGLTVHLGPIVSGERVVTGAARRRLAVESGALAVDTESYWLAPRGDLPFGVVRMISDTDAQPLLRPGIVRYGLSALANLRRAVPALDGWAVGLTCSTTDETLLPKEVS